jgi:hypothetical protein
MIVPTGLPPTRQKSPCWPIANRWTISAIQPDPKKPLFVGVEETDLVGFHTTEVPDTVR